MDIAVIGINGHVLRAARKYIGQRAFTTRSVTNGKIETAKFLGPAHLTFFQLPRSREINEIMVVGDDFKMRKAAEFRVPGAKAFDDSEKFFIVNLII